MTMIIDHGEVRNVQLRVINKKGQEFKIIDAKYELTRESKQEILQSGQCEVKDHVISAIISIKESGIFWMKFIYQIGSETFVDVVEVVSL